MTPTPTSLEKFTLFPRLPLELRCAIWIATCEPRVVELDYEEDAASPVGFCSHISNPPALEVCQESRNAVINSYPLCFGSIFFPAIVRFNFDLDTLYISTEIAGEVPHLFSTFKDAEINRLKYLAMDENYWPNYNGEENDEDMPSAGFRHALKALKSLKEIQVVFDVHEMTGAAMNCYNWHEMVLYDEIPYEISHSRMDPGPLPDKERIQKGGAWDGPCRPVYGWRRCGGARFPGFRPEYPFDEDDEYDSELDFDSDGDPNFDSDSEDNAFFRRFEPPLINHSSPSSSESGDEGTEAEAEADDV